jgi:2-dehydropantoate 2-reductase
MGSIYAGYLADAGHAVTAVDAWPDHVDAINRDGLRIEGPNGSRTSRVTATTVPPHAPADLLILATKSLDVAAAARSASPCVGPATIVLTIQNGLGAADLVASAIGSERLLVGVAGGFGASLRGPGQVHHNAMQLVRIGAYRPEADAAAVATADVWRDAGFNAQATDDVATIQWTKLICNVAFSGPCVIIRGTVGDVLDDPDVGEVSREASREAFRVARALGVALDFDDPVAVARSFGESVRGAKPSTLLDFERGRRSEIDFINGAVAREARNVGLQAPVNATITAFVKRFESTLLPPSRPGVE